MSHGTPAMPVPVAGECAYAQEMKSPPNIDPFGCLGYRDDMLRNYTETTGGEFGPRRHRHAWRLRTRVDGGSIV